MAGFVKKLKSMWSPPDDEYDYYDDYDEIEDISSVNSEDDDEEPEMKRTSSRSSSVSPNRVVNIHATTQLQVVLFKPESFGEETRAVADQLIKMHTVVLNLEGRDKDTSRRILDFISGVAYANNGKIKRVATSTFIVTPYNVDLTGDELMDELESSGMYF
ncbi:MAG: cell division protein SepF [Clostridia bacterium]|nr:cell division protein SepF [Clostridia bacterium]